MAQRAGAFLRSSTRSLSFAAIAALLFGWASPGLAAPEDEAEAFVKKGIALRKQGKDFEALTEFQRAFEIAQTPRTTGQLGLVEFAISRWMPAEEHMEAAVQAAKDPWIAKNRAILNRSLETIRSHIGQIEMDGEPIGAAVFVNGKPRGKLPLQKPIRMGEGFAEVELKAEGHRTERRTLTIRGEFTEQLFMKLDRLGPSAGPAPVRVPEAAASAPVGVARAGAAKADADLRAEADSEPGFFRPLRIASLSLAGVGVAAIATGGVLSVKVRASKDEIQSDAQPGALVSSVELMERIDRGERLARWQWVAYSLGGAALAGAITCWVLDLRASEPAAVALAPVLTPGGAGGSVTVTF